MLDIVIYALIAMVAAFVGWWLVQKAKAEMMKAESERELLKSPGFWLTIGQSILSGAKEITKATDKDPENDSLFEVLLDKADLAVVGAEQVYRKAKEEAKKQLEAGVAPEEVSMEALNDEIKTWAVDTAIEFARLDGKELSEQDRGVIEKLVEVQVGFQNRSKLFATPDSGVDDGGEPE